jgi:hypothetical protein
LLPTEAIDLYVKDNLSHTRDKVYTPARTAFAMIFTGVQEDKSLQNTVNVFNEKYGLECKLLKQRESELLTLSKEEDSKKEKKSGRPRRYKSKIPKSKSRVLSDRTVAYTKARQRLPLELLHLIFEQTNNPNDIKEESWYGYRTYITDGTYVQLQDTDKIREDYPPVENNGMFPQGLLQVFMRQGSGQISAYALGNRNISELELVLPMINKLQEGDLLLADDLYNTYYHFCLIRQQKAHVIVPGKRDRNYTVEKVISDGDEIVKINKTKKRPDYVSKEEWSNLPKDILLRRITYTYQTKTGVETAVLYTTILDEKIEKTAIILKYISRWDVEICIREIKTLMDINVLRAKSPDMLQKELAASLIAYNFVRHIIAKSVENTDFSPQRDIFCECTPTNRIILLDKKGRVFDMCSSGRNRKAEV